MIDDDILDETTRHLTGGIYGASKDLVAAEGKRRRERRRRREAAAKGRRR